MTELKLIMSENPEHGEVTDTVADVFKIGLTIENTLEDGFQLTDFLAAVQLEPTVREVINDFPIFLAQFRTLNGAVAVIAVEEAKARTLSEFGDLGRVGGFLYGFLMETATTFGFIEETARNGIIRLNAWKSLFDTLKVEEPTA